MDDIKQKIKTGQLIPFLGMGVFENTKTKDGSTPDFRDKTHKSIS